MPTNFKLALIQMKVLAGQKEANLRRAEELVGEAARQGAGVIVLPEAMTLGWTDVSAKTEADEIPGGISFLRMQQAAARHGV